jgi:polyphenol oxidase
LRVRTGEPLAERVDVPGDPLVRAGFSDRALGNTSLRVGGGDAQAARARLLAAIGLPAQRAVFMEQVHGDGVASVTAAHAGRGLRDHADALAGVDALVTAEADLALVVQAADCVPLLLALPGRAVGAVHAGRRGVETDVVGAALDGLCRAAGAGSRAEDVVARLGPAIGGCCCEVPAELAERVAGAHPAAAARTRWGTPALDLPAAVQATLRARGVRDVRSVAACTRCAPPRWFSHRADDDASRGRQAGVIARVAPARLAAATSLH